jgi:outer membrane protein assembly factor BamA
VPFIDLPRLGGPVLLRGYDRDRFRDRYSGLATIEYDWPAAYDVNGFLFADAGRVFRDPDDFGVDDLRVGYGAGIQLHTITGFLARGQIASSVDGGLFFQLSLDPTFEGRTGQEL